MAKTGRKEEPEYPITAEKKHAWRARMKRLGISQAILARELNVTRAAISHLFKAAKSSSLVPHLDRVLGFGEPPPPGIDPLHWKTMTDDERRSAIAQSPGFSASRSGESYPGALGDIRDPYHVDPHDALGREIVFIMSQLIEPNREKLVDIARKLLEGQADEIRERGLLIMLEGREREARAKLQDIEDMRVHGAERVAMLEAKLAELKKSDPSNWNAEESVRAALEREILRVSDWTQRAKAVHVELKNLSIMREQAERLAELEGKNRPSMRPRRIKSLDRH